MVGIYVVNYETIFRFDQNYLEFLYLYNNIIIIIIIYNIIKINNNGIKKETLNILLFYKKNA